jgi:hypothetical protein
MKWLLKAAHASGSITNRSKGTSEFNRTVITLRTDSMALDLFVLKMVQFKSPILSLHLSPCNTTRRDRRGRNSLLFTAWRLLMSSCVAEAGCNWLSYVLVLLVEFDLGRLTSIKPRKKLTCAQDLVSGNRDGEQEEKRHLMSVTIQRRFSVM